MGTYRYRANLDALRGVAVLLVVVHHFDVPHIVNAWVGVDVFFVLSGYLITSLLLKERDNTGTVRLGSFYVRRARRLLPCLLVVLAVAYALDRNGWAVLAALGYVANITVQHHDMGSLLHTWTLSVEEQFYIVWPATLLALMRRGGTQLAFRFAVGTTLVLTVITAVRASTFGGDWPLYYSSITRSPGLFIGCALALALHSGWTLPRSGLVAGTGLAYLVVFVVAPTVDLYHGALLLADLAVAAIIAHLLAHPELLTPRWLIGLGRRSYGLYLWHGLLTPHMDLVPGLVLALALSMASYRFIEVPFLRRNHASAVTTEGPVARRERRGMSEGRS